jgi:type IV pilus assembly protein PilW
MKNTSCVRDCAAPRQGVRGMSLIELMIALLIASLVTLAIFAVMSSFEGRKRTTTSVNDANQAGNYALHLLDKLVRSAGSGYVQAGPPPNADNTDRVAIAFGCRLLVNSSASTPSQLLPRGGTLPQPFENVNTGTAGSLRLAPVIVAPSQSRGTGFNNERSDVLLVMAGAAGFGEVPLTLSGPIAANNMPVVNTVSIAPGDLLLLADQPTPADVEDCMVQQVSSTFTAAPIGLTGAYAPTTVAGVSRAIYDDKSVAIKLGHPTNNPPNFLAIGVGDNTTLMSYDLLQTRSPALQAMADNVYELHAVYGVDSDDDGSVNTWVDPRTSTGAFTVTTLMNGTAVSAESIAQIKAIRVALILRSNLQEKEPAASEPQFTPATLTLFQSVGLDRPRNLTTDERRFRYRVIEATIPVRNALLAPSF